MIWQIFLSESDFFIFPHISSNQRFIRSYSKTVDLTKFLPKMGACVCTNPALKEKYFVKSIYSNFFSKTVAFTKIFPVKIWYFFVRNYFCTESNGCTLFKVPLSNLFDVVGSESFFLQGRPRFPVWPLSLELLLGQDGQVPVPWIW